MAYVAAAIGGSAVLGLVGAGMQAGAARDAANAQRDAANASTAAQLQMYNQQRQDQEPWRNAGKKALTGLENADFQRDFTSADFQADPGYAFRMAEGQKALERSAAARGGLQSGGTLKALTRYAQGVASDEYQNAYNRFNADRDRRFNRLASVAGVGQTANSQLAQAGQNYANQVSQNMAAAGNAQAASQVGQANAWGGALQNAGNNWMQYQMLSQLGKGGMGGGGGSAGGSYTNFGNMA